MTEKAKNIIKGIAKVLAYIFKAHAEAKKSQTQTSEETTDENE